MRVPGTVIWTLTTLLIGLTPVALAANDSNQQNSLAVFRAIDVQVVGASAELQQRVRAAIATRPGETTSQRQLQQDVAAILATGLFTQARVSSRRFPNGLIVVYAVEPVVVRSLQLAGAKVLPREVALERFKPQLGTTISPATLSQSVQQINQWYAQNGYGLARVLAVKSSRDGTLTLEVAEGIVVNQVKLRFVNSEGQPVSGRTQLDFLRRELQVKPGQLWRQDLVQQDLRHLQQLGLFRDVQVALARDNSKVDVIYDLTERSARSFDFGGGSDEDRGIYGTFGYQDRNVGGVNNRLGLEIQANFRDAQFESNFNSPYRPSNPTRLGYQLNAFRRRGLSRTFDADIRLANNDKAREGQFGGSISVQRPLADWQASLGLNYTRTSIRDGNGELAVADELGNPLTASGSGIDDLATVSFTATKDERNHPNNPSRGYLLSLGTEQSIPIGLGSILMNRLQANYIHYFPVRLVSQKNSEVVAFNFQGGTTLGDLPPYEAFNLGGFDSVRGYGTGDVASGRSYVLASAEYRFPILSFLGGVFFADFATDLGSGDTVLGEPGVVRQKPGTGFGYGAGVRVDSPIGLIRADFGINDQGDTQLQLGIGQRF